MGHQGGGNNTMKWVIGCGVGCLVVCVIGAIVVAAGGYMMATRGFSEAGKAMATQINTDYGRMKSENKVPAEHTAVFDEIVATTQTEGASMWAVTIASGAIYGILQDGQVSEEEAKQAATIRDFVVANPECTMMQMAEFMQQHPELSHLQQNMPQNMNSYTAPPALPPTVPTETTSPSEAPDTAEAPAGGV
ncbi:MAG: hypothetical protein IT366_04710 [Candidatus Hydrogenedentes bacterium]|nr:hypothetical protein [Candidatus Hydrogenedentota bacterium]